MITAAIPEIRVSERLLVLNPIQLRSWLVTIDDGGERDPGIWRTKAVFAARRFVKSAYSLPAAPMATPDSRERQEGA